MGSLVKVGPNHGLGRQVRWWRGSGPRIGVGQEGFEDTFGHFDDTCPFSAISQGLQHREVGAQTQDQIQVYPQ